MEANILTDPSIAFDAAPPGRVVSLVPSVTASLFELGLGEALVGVTDFCTEPAEQVAVLPHLGGPKTPKIAEIQALRPDLVIANQEENTREAVEALALAGIPVWLTFPLTVQAAINDLWTLANLFRSDLAMQQVDMLERAVEWASAAAAENMPLRYFCSIWQDRLETGEPWWMTFNDQTYPADVLRIFNGVNIFAERTRRYPLLADLGQGISEEAAGRDTRYPCVTLAEITALQPEVILLPSEPYHYNDAQAVEFLTLFSGTPAGQSGRIFTLDGTLINWYGTRLARALEELPVLLAQ